MIRLPVSFIDLILNGEVKAEQANRLGISTIDLRHINNDEPFTGHEHYSFVNGLPIDRGTRNAGLTNMQVGMLKHILIHISGLTIEHYTQLNRGKISRIRNGLYASHIPKIPCTLRQFLDEFSPPDAMEKIIYTPKGVIKLLWSCGVPEPVIIEKTNIDIRYVSRVINELEQSEL